MWTSTIKAKKSREDCKPPQKALEAIFMQKGKGNGILKNKLFGGGQTASILI
jgi:hypothetical protein